MPGPASPPAPVIDRRALSDVAYGFMASKARFAALGVDLFTHLSTGPRTRRPVRRDSRPGQPADDVGERTGEPRLADDQRGHQG